MTSWWVGCRMRRCGNCAQSLRRVEGTNAAWVWSSLVPGKVVAGATSSPGHRLASCLPWAAPASPPRPAPSRCPLAAAVWRGLGSPGIWRFLPAVDRPAGVAAPSGWLESGGGRSGSAGLPPSSCGPFQPPQPGLPAAARLLPSGWSCLSSARLVKQNSCCRGQASGMGVRRFAGKRWRVEQPPPTCRLPAARPATSPGRLPAPALLPPVWQRLFLYLGPHSKAA